jgi:cellulose biosynthesis protein BcsQ
VRNIATIAEHILVPVRASAFDVSGTRDAINLLRECADNTEPEEFAYKNALGKAAIVLNGTPRRQSAKWREELDEALQSCGAGSLPVIGSLSDRAAYAQAIENGHGVTEDAEDVRAVAEILDLYKGLVGLETERRRKINRERR